LAGPERHDPSCSNGYFFAGFWVATRTLIFVAQIEVAEAGQLYLLTRRKRGTQILEEVIDELARFAFVETELVEQRLSHVCFGKRHDFGVCLLLSYCRPELMFQPTQDQFHRSVCIFVGKRAGCVLQNQAYGDAFSA
jgi:hypothetical protein